MVKHIQHALALAAMGDNRKLSRRLPPARRNARLNSMYEEGREPEAHRLKKNSTTGSIQHSFADNHAIASSHCGAPLILRSPLILWWHARAHAWPQASEENLYKPLPIKECASRT